MAKIPLTIEFLATKENRFNAVVKQVEDSIQKISKKEISFAAPTFDIANSLNPATLAVRGLTDGLKRDLESFATVTLRKIGKELDGALQVPSLSGQAQTYRAVINQLDIWKKKNTDLLQSNAEVKSQFESFTKAAKEGLEEINSRASNVASLGQFVALGFAGVGTALAGIATGSLMVAANFEQLEGKLESVTGSLAAAQEKFRFSTEFAAATPFDVRSIVSATAVIEGFQQKSEELLPVAANLAAALGTDLASATLTVAKAASGSLEGFESLRNTYAISTNDIKKFGGAVDGQNQILARTPEQIEKNRNALIKLINLRYGSAIERQSKTLTGALSNVGDNAQTLAARFGQGLVPAATWLARIFSGVLEAAGRIPAPLMAIGAATTVVVAGVAGIGAIVGTAAARGALLWISLQNVNAQLLALGVNAPRAALAMQTLTLGMERAAGAMTLARLRGIAFGGGLLALGSIAAVVGLAIADNMEKAARAAGDAVTKSAQGLASVGGDLRTGIKVLNDANREIGQVVRLVGSTREQMAQINAAFKRLGDAEIVRSFQNSGIGVEQLKAQLEQSSQRTQALKRELSALSAITDVEIQVATDAPEIRRLREEFGIIIKNSSDLDEAVARVNFQFGRAASSASLATKAIDSFAKAFEPLDKANKDTQRLRQFLDLSQQVGTTQALATALGDVEAQIAANARVAQIGSASLDELLSKLRDPALSNPGRETEKTAIEGQIALIQKRDSLREAQLSREKQVREEQIEAQDRALRRAKAVGEAGLAEELALVNKRLKGVLEGTEEEVRLLERRNDLIKKVEEDKKRDADERLRKAVEFQRNALEEQTRSSLDFLREIKNEGALPQEVIAGYDRVIARVEGWRKANQALLEQSPELKKAFESLNRSVTRERAGEVRGQQSEALSGAQGAFQEELSAEANLTEKLLLVRQQIANIDKGINAGIFQRRQGEQAILQLNKQQADLLKQIEQQQVRNQLEKANLVKTGLDEEIAILEQRKALGENVESQLLAVRQERLQQTLNIIAQEAAAEEAAGQDREQVAVKTQAKIQSLLRQEYLNTLQQHSKKEQAEKQHLDRLDGLRQNRLGGKNSPLQSLEEVSEDLSFLGDFSLSSKPHPRQSKKPSPFEVAAKLGLDASLTSQLDQVTRLDPRLVSQVGLPRNLGPVGLPQDLSSLQANRNLQQQQSASAPSQTVNNNNLTFNGLSMEGPEFIHAVEKIIKRANQQAQFKRGA